MKVLLGLDFDNTLVKYDSLFHQIALEKGLIKKNMPKDKTEIRDYLRRRGKEEEFTIMQGEVYGKRILEAEPAEGMLEALKEVSGQGIPMIVISHKTRTPYKGPAYDLRKAALDWLELQGFFDTAGMNWSNDQVFFEETKEEKIKRIAEEKCSHYIDDLPEILNDLPETIKKILYNPGYTKRKAESNIITLNHWNELIIPT